MSRWFARASKAFARREDPVIEPFEIVCSFGHEVRGLRQAGHQEARCSRCGEWLFVLPIDVYPKPKVKRKKASLRTRRARRGVPVPEPPPAPAVPPPKEPEPPQAEMPDSASPAESNDDLTDKGIHKRRLRWRRTAVLTKFRLVLLAIMSVVGVTGYYVYHRHTVEKAERLLQDALDRGEQAFVKHDFRRAAVQLSTACAALDTLGRDDPEARRIRQAFREATAASDLAVATLYHIVSEAQSTSAADPSKWEETFQSRYRNKWIVMETTLLREGSGSEGTLHIDYPLMAGDRQVQVSADLPILNGLPFTEPSRNVVFAAQLDSCRLSGEINPHWRLTLNRKTAFLWCSYDAYAALGFAAGELHRGEEVRNLFREQAQVMGISP